MSNWKVTGQPCPCGTSSDAYAIDVNDNGFCFSCNKLFYNKEIVLEGEERFDYFPNRNISRNTLEFYNTETKFIGDTPFETAFKYPDDHYKIRNLLNKSKKDRFRTTNGFKSDVLYGANLFDPGSKESITITEGESDAHAIYQITGGSTASTSVSSAAHARNACIKYRDYINSFKKIIFCFDNDEPGRAALKTVQGLFDFNKVYIVTLSKHKDATEYLENSDGQSLFQSWRNAARYTPESLISSYGQVEKALDHGDDNLIINFPFKEMNEKIWGLFPSDFMVVKGLEGIGKQLPNTTLIPTPNGYTLMGDLQVGDIIYGADGEETKVTYVTETQYNVPCYEMTFADGSKQISGGPHRWGVYDTQGKYLIKTTEEIFNEGVLRSGNVALYSVPITKPVQFAQKDLAIDPYVLGYWLGDGNAYSANITVGSQDFDEFESQITSRGHSFSRVVSYGNIFSVIIGQDLHKNLKATGVLKNKHIPSLYMRSSIEQRTELLKGLMDSDGSVTDVGCEFYSSEKDFAYQVLELIRSLGFKARIRSKQSKLYGVDKKTTYTVWFLTDDANRVFSFERKKAKVIPCKTRRLSTKTIRSVVKVDSVPSKCITVDNKDHLYLCGDHYTVTHNTEIFRFMSYHILTTSDIKVGLIHVEEDNAVTIRSLCSYHAGIALNNPDAGVSKEQVLSIYKDMTKGDDSRVYIHSSDHMDSETNIIDDIRFMATVGGVKVVMFDHISWFATGSTEDNDDERRKLDRLSQGLKNLAKELDIAIIAISHVNDAGQTRGSRNITKVADLVLHLSRNPSHVDPIERNKTYMTIEKARRGRKSGPCGYSMFDETSCTITDGYQEVAYGE